MLTVTGLVKSFVTPDGAVHGLALDDFLEVVAEADLLLNVSGSALMRDDYLPCRNKILIDTDPGLTQLRNFPRWDERPNWMGTHGYRAHDHFFTYAELIGTAHAPCRRSGLRGSRRGRRWCWTSGGRDRSASAGLPS